VIYLAGILIALAGWLAWRQWFQTYHLVVVRPAVLYRDGVRSRREFATMLRIKRPKTIVSLVDDNEIGREPFVSEIMMCRRQNIDVVRIPIPLGGWPDSAQVQEFLDIAAAPQRQPVLVHCAQGVRRTGMMVAAYQESIMNFDRAKAKAALLDFGHSQRTVGDVERFIDNYDPVARRMLASLPMSQE